MQYGFIQPLFVEMQTNDGSIDTPSNMLTNDTKVTQIELTGKYSPEILLDFGVKTTGFFFIELEASSGDSLLLEYGPLKNTIFFKKVIQMPNNGVLWVDDSYIALRYLRISLISQSCVSQKCFASIKKVGIKFSAYPCIYKGDFECEDSTLNRIWQMGVYTTHLCLQESKYSSAYFDKLPAHFKQFVQTWRNPYSKFVILDGPRRDREVWIGDIRTEALNIYSTFGANEVVKSSLVMFYDLQRTDGIMPGCGATQQELKEYNLWWIIALWEYYLHTGDKEFLTYLYPGLTSLMDWIRFSLDERGFLYNNSTWMWTLPKEGYGAATQCILFEALQCCIKIYTALDNLDDINMISELAQRIKDNIYKEYWDEQRGIFLDIINLDNIQTGDVIFQDVNCYATAFDIATPDHSHRILDYLKQHMWTPFGSATTDRLIDKAILKKGFEYRGKTDHYVDILEHIYPHNRQIWPFVNAYEVEALFKAGRVDDAFDLINRCWANMANKGPGTFWEMVDTQTGDFSLRSFNIESKLDVLDSACHGWSAWVSYLLQKYVMGLQPVKPGYQAVKISPMPGKLKNVSGKWPTQYGLIETKVTVTESEFCIKVVHPKEVTVIFDVCPKVLGNKKLVTEEIVA